MHMLGDRHLRDAVPGHQAPEAVFRLAVAARLVAAQEDADLGRVVDRVAVTKRPSHFADVGIAIGLHELEELFLCPVPSPEKTDPVNRGLDNAGVRPRPIRLQIPHRSIVKRCEPDVCDISLAPGRPADLGENEAAIRQIGSFEVRLFKKAGAIFGLGPEHRLRFAQPNETWVVVEFDP